MEEQKLAIKLRKFNRVCPITGYKKQSIQVGAYVVVQTDRGNEFGQIISFQRGIPAAISRDVRLKKVLRYATEEDIKQANQLAGEEEKAIELANKKIGVYELKIKIINAEVLFSRDRTVFYYKQEDNTKAPNLREFTRDLSLALKSRVDMRQLSPRDEARLCGGFGVCGRPLCCATWLSKPKHVTVKMLKEQGFAINPAKTSGACGRLMCCFEYESAQGRDKKSGQ